MALTPRQQATLDRYLRSFTPDVCAQRDKLTTLADEIGSLSQDYVKALNAISDAQTRLQERVEEAKLLPDEERLAKLDLLVEDHLARLDGILGDAPGDKPSALDDIAEDLLTIRDSLDEVARVLDEQTERLAG